MTSVIVAALPMPGRLGAPVTFEPSEGAAPDEVAGTAQPCFAGCLAALVQPTGPLGQARFAGRDAALPPTGQGLSDGAGKDARTTLMAAGPAIAAGGPRSGSGHDLPPSALATESDAGVSSLHHQDSPRTPVAGLVQERPALRPAPPAETAIARGTDVPPAVATPPPLGTDPVPLRPEPAIRGGEPTQTGDTAASRPWPVEVARAGGAAVASQPLTDAAGFAATVAAPATPTRDGVMRPGAVLPRGGSDGTAQLVVRQVVQGLQPGGPPVTEITLDPVELGRLQMRLVPDEDGLRVVMSADRPETADLLRRHATMLERELRALGHGSVSVDIGNGAGFGAGGGAPDTTPRKAPVPQAWRGSQPATGEAMAAGLAGPVASRTLSASGALDIRL